VEPFSQGIGPALARLRKRAGLTQKVLAEQLNVSQPRLSAAEQPGSPAPARLIEQYLAACGCDVFDLALAFLEPEADEEFLCELALRSYQLDLPEPAQPVALDTIRSHRQTLQQLADKVHGKRHKK
jgi:transcriptional regulator with XRE-family HTH domain